MSQRKSGNMPGCPGYSILTYDNIFQRLWNTCRVVCQQMLHVQNNISNCMSSDHDWKLIPHQNATSIYQNACRKNMPNSMSAETLKTHSKWSLQRTFLWTIHPGTYEMVSANKSCSWLLFFRTIALVQMAWPMPGSISTRMRYQLAMSKLPVRLYLKPCDSGMSLHLSFLCKIQMPPSGSLETNCFAVFWAVQFHPQHHSNTSQFHFLSPRRRKTNKHG